MSTVVGEQIKPYYETDRFSLFCGDCRFVLPDLSSCSVDSVVTDPPYELGFMGKGWDRSGIAYDVNVWRECLRVLKPGGHLLAFGGSRTYHRLACAIEDAGFEIRDQIQWIYGSGFPKSLDVSKAIDRCSGDQWPPVGAQLKEARERSGMARKDLARFLDWPDGVRSLQDYEEGGHCPPEARRQQLIAILNDWAGTVDRWNKGQTVRDVIGEGYCGPASVGFARKESRVFDITTPATDAAKRWTGFGTALKPAHEPIVLARKPLIGTVAQNVLEHGTGGLNIDGCRIRWEGAPPEIGTAGWGGLRKTVSAAPGQDGENAERLPPSPLGRWPANIITDGSEEVLAGFPKSVSTGGDGYQNSIFCGGKKTGGHGLGDSGSASRFFYCAKSSQEDRNEGLGDLPYQKYSEANMTSRAEREGRGERQDAAARNHHPTVKPTELMRYLCRLITPPGGIVLDPFCGSGSTGKAAMLEHFRFIGVELSEDYCQLAQLRIEAVTKQGVLFT